MRPPRTVPAILREAERLGFEQSCDSDAGKLLRVLAASKPAADILELGTGAGHSAAWLLDGMDGSSTLTSVDSNMETQWIAKKLLGHDPRVRFALRDGAAFLEECRESYDLIFADAWPGKIELNSKSKAHCLLVILCRVRLNNKSPQFLQRDIHFINPFYKGLRYQ